MYDIAFTKILVRNLKGRYRPLERPGHRYKATIRMDPSEIG
jgi:hypothetical protein